jgi:hypothetical protein
LSVLILPSQISTVFIESGVLANNPTFQCQWCGSQRFWSTGKAHFANKMQPFMDNFGSGQEPTVRTPHAPSLCRRIANCLPNNLRSRRPVDVMHTDIGERVK